MHRPLLITTAALLALWTSPGAAQSIETGVLLTAAPKVAGFRFARSVVFVIHHDDNGSLGLIVNRPTRLQAGQTFESLSGLAGYAGRVFVGGPLEPTRPLLLVNDVRGVLTDSDPVFGSIHIAASAEAMTRHAERLGAMDESELRVYAGHVQWQPGQLESEVADGRWRVLPGSVDAVFADEPLELYREIGAGRPELVADGAR